MPGYEELRRGWRLIGAACAGVICSSIVLPYYSIGALVAPVTAEFGWTRAQFQTAILFSSGLGALTAPIVGWLIDRYGARKIALPGLVGLGAGFLIASQMNAQLWTLYLAYGAMAILGAGTIPVTWTRAIATNFFERRGLALGLTLTGTGLCAMAAPHYATWLVEGFGWRWAYAGLALLPLALAGPIVFFGFRPAHEPSAAGGTPDPDLAAHSLSLGQAVRGYRFWVLLASILAAYMAFSGIGTNLFPALQDDGLTSSQAATVQSVYGASIIAGRLIVGYLADRYWAPAVAAGSLLLPVAGAWMLIGEPAYAPAAVAAMLIGFAAGAELDLMAFLAARYFGLAHYAKIYSVLYAALAVCSGGAPILFAHVYDRFQTYDLGFTIASGLFAVGALMVLALGPYPDRAPAPTGAAAKS